jgi:hypothetical protein
MEKLHGEPGDGLPLIQAMIIAGSGEVAEVSRLHIHLRGEGEESFQLLRRDRDGHPLLRFGDEDLPGLQAGVFQGAAVEMKFETAGILRHLADGRGEATGAVVGNRTVEAAVAGEDEEVEHAPLGDRIADLDGGHRRTFVQLFGREGGAVDAVLADAAADHNDAIADLRRLFVTGLAVQDGRHDRTGAAVDERLADKAVIEDQ